MSRLTRTPVFLVFIQNFIFIRPELLRLNAIFCKHRILHISVDQRLIAVPDHCNHILHRHNSSCFAHLLPTIECTLCEHFYCHEYISFYQPCFERNLYRSRTKDIRCDIITVKDHHQLIVGQIPLNIVDIGRCPCSIRNFLPCLHLSCRCPPNPLRLKIHRTFP